jgi:hypothetical protein
VRKVQNNDAHLAYNGLSFVSKKLLYYGNCGRAGSHLQPPITPSDAHQHIALAARLAAPSLLQQPSDAGGTMAARCTQHTRPVLLPLVQQLHYLLTVERHTNCTTQQSCAGKRRTTCSLLGKQQVLMHLVDTRATWPSVQQPLHSQQSLQKQHLHCTLQDSQ